jgi:hypothetical protein
LCKCDRICDECGKAFCGCGEEPFEPRTKFKALVGTGWNEIELKEAPRPGSPVDTDEDGITDWEEIAKIPELMEWDSNGIIKLPSTVFLGEYYLFTWFELNHRHRCHHHNPYENPHFLKPTFSCFFLSLFTIFTVITVNGWVVAFFIFAFGKRIVVH